jgi:MFS family permease
MKLLVVSSLGMAVYPALTGLSTSLPPLLGVGALGGFLSAGLTLTLFNTVLTVAPEENRPTHIAVYTMLVNVAAFSAPPLGSLVAESIGIRETLYLGGVLRILGGAVFGLVLLGRPRRSRAPT